MLKGLICIISNISSQKSVEIQHRTKNGYENYYTRILFKDSSNPKKFIKFTEIGSNYFSNIRNIRNIDVNMFLHSLNPNLNTRSLLKVTEGKGKSGSFFFISHDERLIIKIIQYEEKHTFKQILKRYCNHLENNPISLLSIIYSLFSLKVPGMAKINAILSPNSQFIGGKLRVMEYIYIYSCILGNKICF